MRSLNRISARRLLPPRRRDSHKGTYGRALLLAGSENMTGACILASRACLKSGTGLVEISVPESVKPVFQAAVPEVIVLPRSAVADTDLSRFTAVLVGPGLGCTKESEEALRSVLDRMSADIPLVADADALNLIARSEDLKEAFCALPCRKVITPHPGEAARLLGTDIAHIREAGGEAARELARTFGAVCVLKIVPETVALCDGTLWKNPTGNDGMATAGSGDVLAGIITGLLAQGASPEDGARAGAFYHGLAGDRAARKMGKRAVTASDLIEFLKME